MASRLWMAIGAVVLIAAAWIVYLRMAAEGGGGPALSAIDAGPLDDAIRNEDERLAYVAASVEIVDLAIGSDPKPDDAGIVPGVLRVSGTVRNKGDRAVRTVRLIVNPQSSTGKVLGTYIEDVLRNQRLGPGESKAFKFQIPEKPDYAGKFMHEVR
jgi:hypothetical protein